ncbi:MAG TPA: lysylphosphatidylglycerol synthase domain-containing protein, partial [Rhodanobacteraceae bacterium]|nr:lysylphosphatidylglycerol synthase domain-containing protein [Rhodanobacteraceae bacterium]
RKPPRARETIATYAASQYGKYLPGNIAHYALRHAWSRRAGIPHAALGLAAMLEAALLLVAALAASLLGDTERLRVVSTLDPRLGIALLVVILVGLSIALRFARRMHVFERWQMPPPPHVRVLAACAAIYFSFMIASAALLALLAHALGIGFDSFAILLAANAASWAAGFIVVGSPGGLGVREVAFVALAGGALGESRALLLIGVFRVVTFLGDTLFFAAGSLALRGAGAAREDVSIPDSRSAP